MTELEQKAKKLIEEKGPFTSSLQRELGIGYTQAARLIDELATPKDKEWRDRHFKWTNGKITEDAMLTETENEQEHPEWWENPCECYECRSCG